ncbi:MAG: TonB-dependent receptor, partial [Verrucomicrobiota bacterium]
KNDRIWASYSRAERTTPVALSVIDSLRSGKAIDDPVPVPLPNGSALFLDRQLTNAISNRELDPETLDAFEAGYRKNFQNDKGSFWINAYHYEYNDIFARTGISATPELLAQRPYLNVQGSYDNLLGGSGFGFEAYLEYAFTSRLKVSTSYSRLIDSFHSLIQPENQFQADFINFSLDEFDNSSPGHLATLNLVADLSDSWNLNAGLRYSADYEFAKGPQPAIFQLDARLSWKLSDKLRLSLVGRNLLDPYIQEARLKDFFGHWTEMKREVYLEAKSAF